jgi:hypothetical protein
MINPDSFIYQWYDKKNDMYYIGVHKGTPNDGYICSSKIMLEEYNKRKNDFQRTIVKFGKFEELIEEESLLLKEINAAKNKKYYNQHNGDGKFFCKNHTEKTKNIISEKLKKYKKTDKHSLAISLAKKGKIPKCTYTRKSYVGKNNPMYGKKRPELASYLSEKYSQKYIIEGVEYVGLKQVMKKYKLKSIQTVFYRLNSNSEKFKDWNYAR